MQPVEPGFLDPFEFILREIPDAVLDDVLLQKDDAKGAEKRIYTHSEESGDKVAKIGRTIEGSSPAAASQLSQRTSSVTQPNPKVPLPPSQPVLRTRRYVSNGTHSDSKKSSTKRKGADKGNEKKQEKPLNGEQDLSNSNKIYPFPERFAAICELGYLQQVRSILDSGFNVNQARNSNGETPLHAACSKGHAEIARLLIAHGTDVNATDVNGRTPLYVACKGNHLGCARVLIANGAKVDASDCYSQTPLHLVCRNNLGPFAKLLVAHGADVNAADCNGQTPLHLVSGYSYPVFSERNRVIPLLLLGAGADLNKQDVEKNTALHIAFKGGRREMAHLLLEQGADPILTNKDGLTPFECAPIP